MASYEQSTEVKAGAEALFAYLSDVSNLPRYFDKLTSATPADGEAIHTTATLDDGSKVEGEAWFRVDQGDNKISWGSQGPNNYSGELEVSGNGASSNVSVRLHTENVDGPKIDESLVETLANIKRLVEAG